MNRPPIVGLAGLAGLAGLVAVAVIAAAAALLFKPGPVDEAAATAPAERKPLYWYDPMVPDSHFEQPGKSPFMDMELVPKYADPSPSTSAAAPSDGAIGIDPRVVQNLGVRLARVERQQLAQSLLAAGVIAVDERRIDVVQARAAGWVEQLAVRAVGDPVRRGQLLAAVYSPELLAAQDEFLLARRSGDAALTDAARARLALFGLAEAQIRRIAASGRAERRVEYFASRDGYVMELGLRQGAMITPGMTLFQIAGLDQVWLNAELPEAQGAWIQPGAAATASVAALPGAQFAGKVEYLYPELSGATRSLRLRIALSNAADAGPLRLRPGMYASVRLEGAPRPAALTVPSEALIRTGTRSVVLVAEGEARFRPLLVTVGAEVGERSEVLEGLTEGQQVVASGQFLIDSEASLRGALDRLSAIDAEPEIKPSPPGRGLGEGLSQPSDASSSDSAPHPLDVYVKPSPGGRGETSKDDPHAGHAGHAGHQGHQGHQP